MKQNNNAQLRKAVITALQKKLGSKGKADFALLDKKFDRIMEVLVERMATQTINKVSHEVMVTNLKEVLAEVMGKGFNVNNQKEFPKSIEVVQTKKPSWYEAPSKEVAIKAMPAVKIEGVVQVKEDIAPLASLLTDFFKGLVDFFGKMAKGVFRVKLEKDHYLTPQMMILVDPHNGFKPVNMKDIGLGTINQSFSQAISAGRAQVGIAGAGNIADGTVSVTTAGTRVQMPNQSCSRVFVQAHPSNTGDVVIGGETVIASVGTRRGLALFATQWQEFQVSNLNKLWIDSTVSGEKVNYIVEYN
jgi:hypothetical protein